MRDPDDTHFEPVRTDSDELVRRLRELQWPSVRSDVRDRCWSAFNQRLADRLATVDHRQASRRNAGSRLDYSRRIDAAKVPPAMAGCRSRSWAARPSRRISAFAA
jgi:hypothetical protein